MFGDFQSFFLEIFSKVYEDFQWFSSFLSINMAFFFIFWGGLFISINKMDVLCYKECINSFLYCT